MYFSHDIYVASYKNVFKVYFDYISNRLTTEDPKFIVTNLSRNFGVMVRDLT